MTLQHRERLEVDRKIPDDKETSAETAVDEDGQRWERLEVWNFVNVDLAKQARGGGRTETYWGESEITIGGGHPETPDYITEMLADVLHHEYGLNLPSDHFDIEVVDVESDEVVVL